MLETSSTASVFSYSQTCITSFLSWVLLRLHNLCFLPNVYCELLCANTLNLNVCRRFFHFHSSLMLKWASCILLKYRGSLFLVFYNITQTQRSKLQISLKQVSSDRDRNIWRIMNMNKGNNKRGTGELTEQWSRTSRMPTPSYWTEKTAERGNTTKSAQNTRQPEDMD